MVHVSPEPNSGCWLWTAYCDKDGYAVFSINGTGPQRAQRFAWNSFVGDIPTGMQVLHKCDVRCCVNPHHLFLGTNRDNMIDKVAKGRQARGRQTCSSNKLTETQVRAIRADERQQKDIAVAYGISQTNVSMIQRRATWRHV